MIEKELLDLFERLDVNEKRNQVSSELEKLNILLDTVHKQYGIEKMPSSVHTYNKVTDKNISHEQFYQLMYENIIYLRKDLLTFTNAMLKNNVDL